jgi:cell division protein FtsB
VDPGRPHADVAAEVAAKARALEAEPGFPRPFVERVRAATGWLGVADPAPDDVRHAALLLHRQAHVDLEPPMAARDPLRRAVKQLVRRLVGWYVRFLGAQLGALGQAAARLGLAVAERTERLQATQAADRTELQAELEGLRARVAKLEAALAADSTSGTPPAPGEPRSDAP